MHTVTKVQSDNFEVFTRVPLFKQMFELQCSLACLQRLVSRIEVGKKKKKKYNEKIQNGKG